MLGGCLYCCGVVVMHGGPGRRCHCLQRPPSRALPGSGSRRAVRKQATKPAVAARLPGVSEARLMSPASSDPRLQ
jgi:hypothetical protein